MTRIDTPDFRFLADCCAVASGAAPRPVPPGIDGEKLEALARRHRVGAPVLRLLSGADVPIDEAVRARLRTRSLRQTFRANATARHGVRVSAALDAASIRHIFLKGPALAQGLFGNVAARSCKDLDILLQPHDFAAAEARLNDLGFTPAYTNAFGPGGIPLKDLQYWNKEIGLEIELHRRMCTVDTLLPTDFEALWQDRRTVTVSDAAIPVLDAATDFLYLCAHGAQHAWFRLKWLQDIARVLLAEPTEVLAGFAAAADRLNVRPMVASAVALVDEVFGIAPPPPFAPMLPLDREARRVVRASWQALNVPATTFTHRPVAWVGRMALLQWGLRREWAYRRGVIAQMVERPLLPRWPRRGISP